MDTVALRDFFNTQIGTKTCLGTIDCVSFVTEAVKVGWNRDHSGILQYHDRRSAVKRLRELGGLKAACFYAMGDMYFVKDLQPGDVIWYDKPFPTLGLLMPGYVAVRQGKVINRHEITDDLMGWRT